MIGKPSNKELVKASFSVFILIVLAVGFAYGVLNFHFPTKGELEVRAAATAEAAKNQCLSAGDVFYTYSDGDWSCATSPRGR